ncbi:MAG TPA: periplasmic heavy metal sensor [Thermoanaerobaculia bacterium]|nr:periplasmic heavy metal sensor [Thermoanaerobaculia bacterium]
MRSAACMLLLLALSIPAAAAEAPTPGDDPLARHLFPPERVMGHAQEIGLDDAQRTAIRKEVQKAQSKFLDLQFDIQTEMETMVRLVKENKVDEPRVLAQLDKVLALEKEIKKTQISLLVRIKNTLTPAQQARLAEMPREPGK